MEDGPRIRNHEIIVPRTSRYAVLGVGVSDAREIWLVCHGYGQLAERFLGRFSAIDDGKRMIVAPEGLSRFYLSSSSGGYSASDKVGASWMTREGRDGEIVDQIRYLDMVCARVFDGIERSSVRFVALGFSQGSAAVCRWAAASDAPPDEIILWGGAVPADVLGAERRERLQRSSITIVVGSQDEIARGDLVAEHKDQLDKAGLSYRFVIFNGGHEIEERTLREVAARFPTRP